jgi:ankyrin repeat/BTB/POZ domain-containing protein 1
LPYLAERFEGQATVSLESARIQPALLTAVLRWAYTSRLDIQRSQLDQALAALRQLRLPELAAQFKAAAGSGTSSSHVNARLRTAAQNQQRIVLERSREQAKAELAASFAVLLDAADDSTSQSIPESLLRRLRHGALRLRLCDEPHSPVFFVQPMFLAPRSEYFAAMFGRWRTADGSDAVLSECSAHSLRGLLRWAYMDVVDAQTPPNELIQLLLLADRCLCEGLKARVALCLVPHALTRQGCLPLLRLAEQTGAARLGDAAAAAVAQHLEQLADDAQLLEAVNDSAATVRGRESSDSIPVLDEVAFHIGRLHGLGGDVSDEDEEKRWREYGEETAEKRKAKAEEMRRTGRSERRRKLSVLKILQARVQGWEVVSMRTYTT